MTFNKIVLVAMILLTGCGKSNSNSNASSSPTPAPPITGLRNGSTLKTISGPNVVQMTVNGSECAANSYPNKPCVSLTICNPGSTDQCTTINDILVDTGSYGLRVFKSVIPTLNLTQVLSKQGGALTQCAKFGDGTSFWGPVRKADVILGGEAAVTIPIQVIDSTFGTVPYGCGEPDTGPSQAGLNGILGVGLYSEDCGAGCTGSHISNGMYFTCTGGNSGVGSAVNALCPGGSTLTTADQVQNPVSAQAVDNNGVLLSLPTVPDSGAASVNGYLILGVGTRENNVPDTVSTFPVDPSNGTFKTIFQGTQYRSFTDSGSNGIFFTAPSSIPNCSSRSSWLCPTSPQTLEVVNVGYSLDSNPMTGSINFQIGNQVSLFNTGNNAFNNLGGSGGNMFDFGLPFYFGRNFYLGIEGKSSSLGQGPYWAF